MMIYRSSRFLKVAFMQPRKTLMKNLSSTYDKKKLQEIYQTLNLKKEIRPHQLTTDDYHQLYKLLS